MAWCTSRRLTPPSLWAAPSENGDDCGKNDGRREGERRTVTGAVGVASSVGAGDNGGICGGVENLAEPARVVPRAPVLSPLAGAHTRVCRRRAGGTVRRRPVLPDVATRHVLAAAIVHGQGVALLAAVLRVAAARLFQAVGRVPPGAWGQICVARALLFVPRALSRVHCGASALTDATTGTANVIRRHVAPSRLFTGAVRGIQVDASSAGAVVVTATIWAAQTVVWAEGRAPRPLACHTARKRIPDAP